MSIAPAKKNYWAILCRWEVILILLALVVGACFLIDRERFGLQLVEQQATAVRDAARLDIMEPKIRLESARFLPEKAGGGIVEISLLPPETERVASLRADSIELRTEGGMLVPSFQQPFLPRLPDWENGERAPALLRFWLSPFEENLSLNVGNERIAIALPADRVL